MTIEPPRDAARPSPWCCEILEGPQLPSETLDACLDDATITYVMAARLAFDGLRKAEGQLAGVLVLAAAGGRSAAGHPVLALARDVWREAADQIGTLPRPPRARHHYHHLRRAAACVGRALAAARRLTGRNPAVVDAILEPLRAAHQELQYAAASLPGFEIVAFQQGCCASHAATRGIRRDTMRELIEPAEWRRR